MLKKLDLDIKKALKSSDKGKLIVLRSLKSALKNEAIERGNVLTEAEELKVLKKQVKSREQAIELYKQGNRPELAKKEQKEIELIQRYLPHQLSESELEAEVDKVISELDAKTMKNDMGKVMKTLKEKLGIRADGKILSRLVRTKLK
ncbi:MAG: GatB/YqeY domain-containing protein [Candidatus Cloacimonadota bacterium]|nr:GatB/YqeY domain-containing protein [Candidatus Cloacimonadota bacterium]